MFQPNILVDRRTAMAQIGALAAGAALAPRVLAQAAAPVTSAPVTSAPAFTLPVLPYAYDALEPVIDAETMHLHYDKHHQAYVNNLNTLVAAHPELNGKSIEDLIGGLNSLPEAVRTGVRNQGGGHLNHSLFWQMLAKGGGAPKGELAKAIDQSFGSFSAFQDKLTAATVSVFGSGWGWLVKLPDGKLAIEQSSNQESPLTQGHLPLLGIDVWEHAYYLQYQNKRADYVKAIFQVVHWDWISARYAARG